MNVLDVRGLAVTYGRSAWFDRLRKAQPTVSDVSFSIAQGSTFSLVGESGCGKTTVARAITQLVRPMAGEVTLNGVDLTKISGRKLRIARRKVQMVFQDPSSSLNRRWTIRRILAEPLRLSRQRDPGATERELIEALLGKVGLPEDLGPRYVQSFSGGQRQRIAIARALAAAPDLIVCDEALSALDVSVQAQIINLLRTIQQETGIAFLFIAHDLSVVRYISDTVAVMYAGRIVEMGPTVALFERPLHPYTSLLLDSIPVAEPGYVPTPSRRPEALVESGPPTWAGGCAFRARCPLAMPVCAEVTPQLEATSGGRVVACHAVELSRAGTGHEHSRTNQ